MVDQPQSSASSGSQVLMMSTPINVATRLEYYQTPTSTVGREKEVAPSSSTPSYGPLHIECPNPDSTIWPPSRGVLWKSSYNPNSRTTQNYCWGFRSGAISYVGSQGAPKLPITVEIFVVSYQRFWSHDSNLICFDLENHVLCLPHQIAFLIQVIINEKTIHQTIIDEGASTYVMSTTCWKAISSPALNQSSNRLEAFDGCDLWPFDVLPNLSITLEDKIVQVEVEIVDTNLNYNILLG